ncbi:MAG: hypothetical protein V4596_07045 [Bdellovibrionota bacterium]
MKQFALALSLLLTTSLHAEESEKSSQITPSQEEKFAAIVQYTNGKTELDFKDLITFDKTIEVPKNANIKVVTQKRCVAVFYENTKLQSPTDKVSPWKILSGNVRWICPEDRVERIVYKDTEIQVQNGEFLLLGNQLTAIRDNVRYDGKDLKLETIYVYKNGKWLSLKEQPDPYDLWKKHDKFPPPLESTRLKMEKPIDPYVTRVFLNVAPVGIAGFYHHELENTVSEFDMDTHAFRLGTNFPWRGKSIFTFLEFNQGESKDNKNQSMGPPPIGFRSIRFEAFTLGLGLRHSHVSSSSYYYYLGLTRQRVEFHLRPESSSFYDGEIEYPYNITVGGGYQKIFWAKNWISLVIGVDLKLIQSLSQGKVEYFNQPFSETKDPRSTITEYAGFLYLGPTFNF